MKPKLKKTETLKWGIRNWIQLGVFMLTLVIGLQFFIYIHQALNQGAITVDRPPGVEGFLPIGALMGWKLFIATGIWDPVHPAAMVLLGFAGLISFLFRKSFCSWFCPVGTLSEWIWKLGAKIFGKNMILPNWLDYPLRSIKYLLLGFFVWIIFSMETRAVFAFLQGDYYKLSDVKMLFFFTKMTGLTFVVLLFLTLVSLPVKNFWCRYLCPYGAVMGIFALFSPSRVKRNPDNCIKCGRCSRICPSRLPVDKKISIASPECSGCMDCTEICPVEDTLNLKTVGSGKKVWSTIAVGVVILVFFSGLVVTARVNGHWQTRISENEFRMVLQRIDSPELTHP